MKMLFRGGRGRAAIRVALLGAAFAAGPRTVQGEGAPGDAVTMPGTDSVWTYFSFDETAAPLLPAVSFREVSAFGAEGSDLEYVSGLVGQAVVAEEGGAFLSIVHGRTDFPVARGSMTIWFKPDRPLGKASHWLVEGAWAGFSMHVSGDRLLAYATGNSQHLLAGSLKPWSDGWTGRWHHAVLTWDGPRRRLFVNGESIAERGDVAPFAPPRRLEYGVLHRPRDREKPYVGVLDGAIDEFAILRVPLSLDQARLLFRRGRAAEPQGLLTVLGGAVTLTVPRCGFVRGERAQGQVGVHREGDAVEVRARPEAGGDAVLLAVLAGESSPFGFDTRVLRPGRYWLHAELVRGNAAILRSQDVLIGIRPTRRPEFPIGLDGLAPDDPELLARAAAWHIDHTGAGGDTANALYWRLDRLFTYGIGLAPNLNVHWHRSLPLPDRSRFFDPDTGRGTEALRDEVLQVIVLHGDGSFEPYSTSGASPFAPLVQDAMRRRVTDYIRQTRNHPGLVSISFDDEYVFRMSKDAKTGKVAYGDYSPGARNYFRQETGLDPVFPPRQPPGTVIEDDHPYFKWRDVIGMPHDASCAGLAKSHGDLTEVVHALRPDVMTTTWSGGEYGIVDAVMDYAYPSIWQPDFGFNIGHGRVDFHKDRMRARQRVEPLKPLWGLVGWWSADLSDQPAHCVEDFRLNTIMSLSKGDESITWFTLYQGGILSRDDLKNEMVRWADWIHRYGPMFSRFEAIPSRRMAVLLSEDNVAGHIAHTGNGIHTFGAESFYPALRIAGAYPDVVTDERIEAGVLEDYEALALYGFNYASRGLWAEIEEFAGLPGRKVFVDADTALKPEGAIELPFSARGSPPAGELAGYEEIPYYGTRNMAWMAGRLKDLVTPRLSPAALRVSGSELVAPFWLYSRGRGRGRLLMLVNYDTVHPHEVEVYLEAAPDTVVQELDGGEEIAFATSSQPKLIWKTALGPADWKVYWLYPGRMDAFTVEAACRDNTFTVRAAAFANDMQPLLSGLPVRVAFTAPDGREVEAYRTYTALDPDSGTLELALPRATRMDAGGAWSVTVTDLVNSRSATATFAVSPADGQSSRITD